jgi:hypothetical protein
VREGFLLNAATVRSRASSIRTAVGFEAEAEKSQDEREERKSAWANALLLDERPE